MVEFAEESRAASCRCARPYALKKLKAIFIFGIVLIGGLLFSLSVTLVPWNIQIEHRAFQCTDDVGFGSFFEDMDIHRGAGDTVSLGWTWEKLKVAKTVYEIVFFVIWLSIPTGSLSIFWRNRRKYPDLNRPLQEDACET